MFSIPDHEYVILCAVKNEQQLLKWESKLKVAGIQYCAFYEPDIGNQITAIATEPVSDRRPFRSLQLLKGECYAKN